MVSASSINVDAMKITALSFSNALVAVSGGLIAQYQGLADVNSGSGMLVVGLASVIYRYIIAAATKSSFFPAYAPSGSAGYYLSFRTPPGQSHRPGIPGSHEGDGPPSDH